MTATDPTAPGAPPIPATGAREADDAPAKRAVGILVWCQAVLGAMMPVHMITGTLAGATLTTNQSLATLPIAMMIAGSALTAPVLSALMARFGRRPGFIGAALVGAGANAGAVMAIEAHSFLGFCLASAALGVYFAANHLYRFAAADLASPAFRPKAISWVMAGGLVAAVLGPKIVRQFGDAWAPVPFAGAYAVMACVALVGLLPLFALDIPPPRRRATGGRRPGRPLRQLLADRGIAVPMLCAMVSYALMTLMMTATPLAMAACGFGTGDSAGVVRAHVLAMYAPSFFTGALVARFGAPTLIAAGLACLAGAGGIALTGVGIEQFYGALILLGLGWNFGFIGATAMLTENTPSEERERVQGLNDGAVMGFVLFASLSSGVLLDQVGWHAVQAAMLPLVTLAAGVLAWSLLSRRAQTA
ncbi:MAG: MFS transporter [Pseudomonadota bacterium]